jgi:hypothetical protein
MFRVLVGNKQGELLRLAPRGAHEVTPRRGTSYFAVRRFPQGVERPLFSRLHRPEWVDSCP